MYPPLDHGLRHHFLGPQVTPGNQELFVGTRPIEGGEVASVIRVDGCATEAEAVWLGEQIHADLISHLCFVNQEDVPFEAVAHEYAVPSGGVDWSVAVYVILESAAQGKAMVAFLTEYAASAVDHAN